MYVNGGSYLTTRSLDVVSDPGSLSVNKLANPTDTAKDALLFYNKKNLSLSNAA